MVDTLTGVYYHSAYNSQAFIVITSYSIHYTKLYDYVPGILMGLGVMIVAWLIAKRRNYPVAERTTWGQIAKTAWDALPSLFLIFIIMGGIISGVFTATEASAIAIVYTFFLAVIVYRQVKLTDLPKIILDSAITTSVVLLLIGCSMGMSWAMANADVPFMISDAILGISDNPLVILFVITSYSIHYTKLYEISYSLSVNKTSFT